MRLWIHIALSCLLGLLILTPAGAQQSGASDEEPPIVLSTEVAPDTLCEACGQTHQISGGTGGATINSPKNVGQCELTLQCCVGDRVQPGSLTLPPGTQRAVFSCQAGEVMKMKCEDGDNHDDQCKLQYTPATRDDS